MKAMEQLMLASHMRQQAKQAGALGRAAMGAADIGSYFIPGVGTARMGYDAFKDFGSGNYLGGAANLLGAGLSLIPGAGGLAGKGVSMLGRLGAKGLARVGAPALSKGFGAGVGAMGKGLSRAGTMLDAGVSRAGAGAANMVGRVPRVGGVAAGAMRGAGNFATKNPGTTGLAGFGASMGLHNAQAGVNEGKAIAQQNQQGMSGMMNMMRSRPIMSNPMYARPGGY